MLKLLYKTLLISVLSGCLMLMDFSYKGIMLQTAQAETVKTDGIKDSDLMATLTMTAVGLLSSRLMMCKMTADMAVAAAGGAAFVAGEILSTIKLKKVMKDIETEITRDKEGNINNEQIKNLERLKKSYEEAKKTANTKKMLQMAAAAAFAAAAVIAYMLAASEETAKQACNAALQAEGAQCPGLSVMTAETGGVLFGLFGARLAPAPSAAGQATQTANEAAEKTSEAATTTTAETLAAQYTATCAASYGSSPACQFAPLCAKAPAVYVPACAPITPILKTTTGFCPAPLALTKSSIQSKALYAKSLNPQLMIMSLVTNMMFPSKAQADLFTPMGIASSAAITFLLMTSKTLGATIDTYLLAPMNRAIIWGILAGLTFAASTATDNVIKKLEANITKIDNILKSLNTIGNATETTQTSVAVTTANQGIVKPGTASAYSATDYEAVDLSDGGNGALPCYTENTGGNCKSFENTLKDLPSFSSLDAESQKQALSVMSTASGLNGTSKISSGTLNGAAALANSANALNANLAKAKAKAAANLKASGSKFNIDDQSKKFSDALEKSVNDGLKSGKTTASGMMASMYGGSSSSGTASAIDDKKTAAETVKKVTGSAAIINTGNGLSDSAVGLTGVDSGEKKYSAEEVAAYNNATKSNMDDYDLKNDISTDTGANLFELISNRYQQSGYPRLFKLKEPAAATTEAVKN